MKTTIFDRTHFLSKSQMQRILDAAAVENELHLIYWFVEAKLPSALSPTGRPQLQAASFPDKWIPVVAVGPAPATSRHYADLLVECFKASNRGIEFGLGLTMAELLTNYRCYEWGDLCWDNVCVICGAVTKGSTVGVELCPDCEQRERLIVIVEGG